MRCMLLWQLGRLWLCNSDYPRQRLLSHFVPRFAAYHFLASSNALHQVPEP